MKRQIGRVFACLLLTCGTGWTVRADEPVPVEGQPLAANVQRLLEALDYLGSPLPAETTSALRAAIDKRDATELQRRLDAHVTLVVSLNPESRVKVRRGEGPAVLQQAGFTPILVKVVNASTVTKRLRMASPQAGPVYAGVAALSMQRQQQEELRQDENTARDPNRFLAVEMFSAPPLTDRLSGLAVEYALALIYSSESGKREATIQFDVGQGTQDLGFRGEVPVLFDVHPAIPVRMRIVDEQGQPSVARLLFRDALGHVYPPQAKRLAPDFFFQPHIYRRDGEIVWLPPGKFTLVYGRGPEYRLGHEEVSIGRAGAAEIAIRLERWINPADYGFYSGDHHIHAAGCAHYSAPTEGVTPADMFRQVQGEALNVGCVLTWGPCFDYQRQFFAPHADEISEPFTVLKYDLEISGFGSQALGHVCLLNLQDETYPGSDGTATKGWPTWATPVMRWAKQQGGVTGYAHSASGLQIDPPAAARRLLERYDRNGDKLLTPEEAEPALLPEPFATIDSDEDQRLSLRELTQCHDRVADRLPNLAIPEMNGVGAMEICVSVVDGACDFISAMDTPRIQEWNCWYHILNCGFPLKVSGETDFPCMSGREVGQGRVYVQLQKPDRLDFAAWCRGLAAGRSYVSDGYAHALSFEVAGQTPGNGDVHLEHPGTVPVRALVAFAPEMPRTVATGAVVPPPGVRAVGDTVVLHGPRTSDLVQPGPRLVEIVVNGQPVASQHVPADGSVHELKFEAPIERSSWIALRQFPQLHTNPVQVLVAGQPIRASRDSALWCLGTIDLLWRNRERTIAPAERDAARVAFDRARDRFRQIAIESEQPPTAGAGFEPAAQERIFPRGSMWETVWGEGEFTEGPAAAPDGTILFSDIGNRILRFDPKTRRTTVYRDDSGRANGLAFDAEGRLVACEGANSGGRRRISITMAGGQVRGLAERYEGRRFNSPNDLAIDPRGRVYFTDPRYVGDEPRELDFEGVFLVDPAGQVRLATRDVQKPNGILVAPDGNTVYVADHDSDPLGNHHLLAFHVQADGTLTDKRVLYDFGPRHRGIDGMALDRAGNIFAAAGAGDAAGIYVFAPDGKPLAFLATPGDPTNCTFARGADAQVLYCTSALSRGTAPRYGLLRVRLAAAVGH